MRIVVVNTDILSIVSSINSCAAQNCHLASHLSLEVKTLDFNQESWVQDLKNCHVCVSEFVIRFAQMSKTNLPSI